MTFSGHTSPEQSQQPNSFSVAPGSSEDSEQLQITDDLLQLLEILPVPIRQLLLSHLQRDRLVEVVLDLGRRPEARFPDSAEYLSETPVSRTDLDYCIERVGIFSGDNRAGIERTLHRISAIRNRSGEIIGLTCRVGRAVFGTVGMIRDLVETGRSILMLGRPGVGKTTALREVARILADELHKRVVIIDTSNEIAGDGDIPHPAIGRARRMQVARPELQHQVMIEAVENHMPEVIVIDEIGTELEALAARTIAERGVQLVGTAHGNRIENLIKNPTLSDLVGGIQSVTLGDEEARRRGSQKSVLERKAPPTFDIAIEMLERQKWIVHENVSDTVDTLLRGKQPALQLRTVDEAGKVVVTQEQPSQPTAVPPRRAPFTGTPLTPGFSGKSAAYQSNGWRASGQMTPLPTSTAKPEWSYNPLPEVPISIATERQQFDQLLNDSFAASFEEDLTSQPSIGPNGEDLPLHIYPYGIGRHQLEQVIQTLNLPVVLTKDIDSADAVLGLRSHLKSHSKLRLLAKNRQIPIHAVKANSIPQIVRSLRRILHLEDIGAEEPDNLALLYSDGDDDEIEALEEARLAVEQIVIPKGQPVELLPRSAKVRKMQHELVEHYRLKSTSFGEEPNRRLRIFPA
jgi:stage III sporulation protein SpoIIIAA